MYLISKQVKVLSLLTLKMRGLAAFSFFGLLAIETATALKSNAKLAVAGESNT